MKGVILANIPKNKRGEMLAKLKETHGQIVVLLDRADGPSSKQIEMFPGFDYLVLDANQIEKAVADGLVSEIVE